MMKLTDLKIKQIKKHGEKLNKQILVIFKAEYSKEGPLTFRKEKKEMLKRSNKLWEEGLAVQNNKIKHLSWKWGSCSKHPCCNWVRRTRASQLSASKGSKVMDGTEVSVDVTVKVSVIEEEVNVNNVQPFVHNFHCEG